MARSNKNNFSLPTVKFDQSKVTNSVKTDLRDNIERLEDISATDCPLLYEAALKAILAGGDLYSLSQTLIELGMTKRRAAEISCDLSNNATILMEAERREKLGITHAIWLYTGVPCGDYEQNLVHKEADGKHFPITEGLYIGDRFMLPGRDGCHCVSKSYLPWQSNDDNHKAQAQLDDKNEQTQTGRRWGIFRVFDVFKK